MSRLSPAELPAVLGDAGLRVGIVPDWLTNGHGAMRSIDGNLLHHTAGHRLAAVYAWPGRWPDARPSVPSPRCNLWWPEWPDAAESGMGYDVWVVTAGMAYHAGEGSTQALADIRTGRMSARVLDAAARGLPDDGAVGSAVLLGHEVENLGVGTDPYPAEQLGRLCRGVAAINQAAGLTPGHVGHHRQYTRRKPDMSWRGDIWTQIARAGGEEAGLSAAEVTEIKAHIDVTKAQLQGQIDQLAQLVAGYTNARYRAGTALLGDHPTLSSTLAGRLDVLTGQVQALSAAGQPGPLLAGDLTVTGTLHVQDAPA